MWPHGMKAWVSGWLSTQNAGSIPIVSSTRHFSFSQYGLQHETPLPLRFCHPWLLWTCPHSMQTNGIVLPISISMTRPSSLIPVRKCKIVECTGHSIFVSFSACTMLLKMSAFYKVEAHYKRNTKSNMCNHSNTGPFAIPSTERKINVAPQM